MWKKIWTLVVKELLAVLQDKKSRTILILPPLTQLLIFSYAATLDVKNVTLGVFNQDNGKFSYELIQRFAGSPTFSKILYLQKEEEIAPFIDEQKGSGVLHFDAQFSRDLFSGKPAEVQMIFDGRKSNTTQIILGYANQIVQQFDQDIATIWNLPHGSTELIFRHWFNPNLIYSWFTVPGLVATLAMMISLLVTAMTVARERELGTFDQLLVSPLQPFEILLGKTIPGILIGMAQATLMVVAAVFFFQVPFTGSLWLLYGSLFFFILSIVGVGLFLSSIAKTQQQALLYVFVFIAPAVILSGFATPVENMPVWLQKVTVINPLKHFLVVCRGVFLKSMPCRMVLDHTYPLICIAAVNLIAAGWFFRRKME